MRYIFSVLLIFLSGCSHSLFQSREYDVRNTVLQKPLVIPNNVYNLTYYNKNFDISNKDVDSTILHILFNENFSQDINNNILLSKEDIDFLKLLKADKAYPNIRNEVNQESLAITSKNSKFINHVLDWQIDEALTDPCTEYQSLNKK